MTVCNNPTNCTDGIHSLLPENLMVPEALHLRKTYARTPGIPLFQREFGFFSIERWRQEGLPENVDFNQYFGYSLPGNYHLGQLGWCEAAFCPIFEEKVLEDRGDHEVAQDFAGRKVLFFKGRRSGFMPEYLDHPVKDRKTWEELCLWRLNPGTRERYADLEQRMEIARQQAAKGLMISQNLIGGYMYLRSLIGPADLLYFFHDQPDLIHSCMEAWFNLADAVIARHQQYVTLDEVFLAEDICYNKGPLISPKMMREFLFPYYRKLLDNIRSRQIDQSRHIYLHVDTDGYANPVIPVYMELGMDVMSPFEVASGCDVVEIGKQFPQLAIFGGIDKRVLASSKADIDAMVDRILPVMKARGGYIPTCDHGVPEEVSLENYKYFRKRMLEFA